MDSIQTTIEQACVGLSISEMKLVCYLPLLTSIAYLSGLDKAGSQPEEAGIGYSIVIPSISKSRTCLSACTRAFWKLTSAISGKMRYLDESLERLFGYLCQITLVLVRLSCLPTGCTNKQSGSLARMEHCLLSPFAFQRCGHVWYALYESTTMMTLNLN